MGKFAVCVIIAVFLCHALPAGSERNIPLDVYLAIGDYSAFRDSRDDASAWLIGNFFNRILFEGDSVTVRPAREKPKITHSVSISGGRRALARMDNFR